MALDDDEANLFLLAFKKKFSAECPRRRWLPPPIDLLELSAGATIMPFVVVAALQQQFDGHFWWVEPHMFGIRLMTCLTKSIWTFFECHF